MGGAQAQPATIRRFLLHGDLRGAAPDAGELSEALQVVAGARRPDSRDHVARVLSTGMCHLGAGVDYLPAPAPLFLSSVSLGARSP